MVECNRRGMGTKLPNNKTSACFLRVTKLFMVTLQELELVQPFRLESRPSLPWMQRLLGRAKSLARSALQMEQRWMWTLLRMQMERLISSTRRPSLGNMSSVCASVESIFPTAPSKSRYICHIDHLFTVTLIIHFTQWL